MLNFGFASQVLNKEKNIVGFLKSGASAVGKLFVVIALAGAFIVGLVGVVYLSLQGKEVSVPEIVGKDFYDSEKELTQLGLKIKKRAFRYSQEKPNTIIEQSPRSGEPVKTGQIIFVVVSQANPEGSEAPATVNKDAEDVPVSDDGIENAPKKTNKNANVKKPAQISRDGAANKPPKNSNSNVASNSSANTGKTSSNSGTTPSENKSTPANKATTTPSNSPKPSATKTPTSGGTRDRKIP